MVAGGPLVVHHHNHNCSRRCCSLLLLLLASVACFAAAIGTRPPNLTTLSKQPFYLKQWPLHVSHRSTLYTGTNALPPGDPRTVLAHPRPLPASARAFVALAFTGLANVFGRSCYYYYHYYCYYCCYCCCACYLFSRHVLVLSLSLSLFVTTPGRDATRQKRDTRAVCCVYLNNFCLLLAGRNYAPAFVATHARNAPRSMSLSPCVEVCATRSHFLYAALLRQPQFGAHSHKLPPTK